MPPTFESAGAQAPAASPSPTPLKTEIETLIETEVKNMTECEKSISDIKLEINQLFDNFVKHLELLRDKALQEVTAAEKEILPNLESERDELKCKVSAIENDIQVLHTNTEYAPPAQYLQAMEKLSEQSHILDRYIKDKTRSFENIRISFKANEKISEITKSLVTFGTVAVHREMLSTTHTLAKDATRLLSCTPTTVLDKHINVPITGAAVLDDGRILISNNSNWLLELLDDNGAQLSSLALPGYPWDIKMTSDTEGTVVIWDTAILFFQINSNDIVEVSRVQVPVSCDYLLHKGIYYIGSDNQIIVQDSNQKHVRNIAVNGRVGGMATRNEDTLCYTVYDGRVLHCITLEGKEVFQYCNDKLSTTNGVTVDCAGNIYVCGRISSNVHQLTYDGKLHRIIFDNLPAQPYCIIFNKDYDKVVIGYTNRVSLYKLT